GPAPDSFKGFAYAPARPACGMSFTADTGNSYRPPASVPKYMAVFASGSIAQSGSVITGNSPKMVIVQTAFGYAPNPGHAGTGKVIAVLCPCPAGSFVPVLFGRKGSAIHDLSEPLDHAGDLCVGSPRPPRLFGEPG